MQTIPWEFLRTLLQLSELTQLQDTRSTHKNQSYFYTLAIDHRKPKLKQQQKNLNQLQELKRLKHLHINLPKYVQDPHTENYKTPKKEVKDDLSTWTDGIHGPEDSKQLQCQFSTNSSAGLTQSQNPSKIFLTARNKLIRKLYGTEIFKTILKKN